MINKYFQLSKQENKAVVNIFGDIVDDVYADGICALSFAYELEQLGDVDEIDVYINSYGGSVAQGFAIYNQLKNHPAKITTICSGFACSIASIVFLAGDERVMQDASLFMIHNPFCMTVGNAHELRKTAEDLDKMAQVSVDIYCKATGLDESTVKQMMDAETWLSGKEAVELGFATKVEEAANEVVSLAVQSVKHSLVDRVLGANAPQQQNTVSDDTMATLTTSGDIMAYEVKADHITNEALNNFLELFKNIK